MAEPEFNEAEVDGLLRRSMTAPIPTLSPEFDQHLMSEVSLRSQPLGRYQRGLLAGYGILSVVACSVSMHGQGLDWTTIAASILGPLFLVGVAPALRLASRQASP